MLAQEIDFGDDSSQWANDGECDDKRFTGPSMATILLDSDIAHDASDCRAGYESGKLQFAATSTQPPAAPTASSGGFSAGGGGKNDRVRGGDMSSPPKPADVVFDGIRFGDDSGSVTNDGECDDRRFAGPGMAGTLSWENLARDASDCLSQYQSGGVYLWDEASARQATSCQAIDFGDDTGDYPNDSECDDYRFEGRGVAMNLFLPAAGSDASDCARLCDYGMLSLRDYR
ncbi:MAG TPA: hypothetical protein ENK83_04390 [Aliiroseovarius sp.]|nr:hypothetical protein [Aliiroseovarius sp.]